MNTESIQGGADAPICPVCRGALGGGMAGGMCPKCLLEGAAAPTEVTVPGGAERPGLPDRLRLAEVFPELEIHGLVGAGGMGAVFKARQPHLDRWVALKVLPEHLASHPDFVERFHREARTLARLNHPNIVTVHDFGRREGYCFLLMEFVDGVNLRQAMRAGRLGSSQALGMVPRICEALQFAHEEGVLHRDIKPENILLDGRGRVKIADFGIAKLMGEAAGDRGLTVSGAALGTPAYMAPEQIENPSEVDHRADIYSLGVVFYEMLTGELPLGRFAPPSEKAPLDHRVDEIVMRALAKERELRQQSAAQVRTEVEGVTGPGRISSGSGRAEVAAGEPDFVLRNPRLPRMAQWITVYGLVVAPLSWLAGLSLLEEPADPSLYAVMVEWLQNIVLVVGELVVVAMWMAGGWKLRGARVSGPRWIRAGIVLHLALGAVAVAMEIWLESGLRRAPAAEIGAGHIWIAMAGLGAMVFEIVAWIWLNRHAHRLALIFAEAAPSSEEARDEVAMTAPTVGVARHATLAAILTCSSVVFGLGAVGGAALLVMALLQNRLGSQGGLGLGPAEFAIALVGLIVVGGGGVVGGVLGWGALREIKTQGGRMGGVGRGFVAALAWPLLVVEMAAMLGMGWTFFRLGGWTWITLLLGVVVTLSLAEVLVRAVWRWVRGVPRGVRAGRMPGWSRGLVLASALAAFATLFPAYSVGWSHYLRSQIPPMVATVAGRVNGSGDGVLLDVSYPPRAIVTWRASVYRGHQLLTEDVYRAHVVNGSLWESVEAPVRVAKVADGAGDAGAWSLEVVTDRHTASYRSSAEFSRGVTWEPVTPEHWRIGVGEEVGPIKVLRGRGNDGQVWAVSLSPSVQPLPPDYLFGGALAGQGDAWEATAARAVALEKQSEP